MKQKSTFFLAMSGLSFLLFGLLTTLVLLVDVRPVGPGGSAVGLASLNLFVLQCLGGSPFWYRLTEALGLTAILCAAGFALIGLLQLLQRRSFRPVDRRLRYMGGFYALVLAVYLLFEALPVSFRPILVNGKLEASYPSSHTVLVLCVMGTALLYLHSMEGRCPTRLLLGGACLLAMVLTVLGRLLSGVHWCTDVIGGVLVSSGLVLLYAAAVARLDISGHPS